MTESTDGIAGPTPTEEPSVAVEPLEMGGGAAAFPSAQVEPSAADVRPDAPGEPPAPDLAPVADPPVSSLVPSTSGTPTTGAHARTGPKGKTRSPIGGWLLLIPTFGIYYLFWYFNINRELRDYDPAVKVSPGWAVVSLFIPIVGLISIYNTGTRIRQAQTTAGAPAESSGLIGLVASLFLVLDLPYYNVQLNNVWKHA